MYKYVFINDFSRLLGYCEGSESCGFYNCIENLGCTGIDSDSTADFLGCALGKLSFVPKTFLSFIELFKYEFNNLIIR
jgi:hypothetical protein